MPHAIQMQQTGGPEVLNWTTVDVGEPASGQVRLRQAAAMMLQGMTAHVLIRQVYPVKAGDSILVHAAAGEASANELFEVVASGKVRIHLKQRFALKEAADAHKALEARAISDFTILAI